MRAPLTAVAAAVLAVLVDGTPAARAGAPEFLRAAAGEWTCSMGPADGSGRLAVNVAGDTATLTLRDEEGVFATIAVAAGEGGRGWIARASALPGAKDAGGVEAWGREAILLDVTDTPPFAAGNDILLRAEADGTLSVVVRGLTRIDAAACRREAGSDDG